MVVSPFLDVLWLSGLFFHFTGITQAQGHTIDPVVTDNYTSYLTITSIPSTSLILKLPFQQSSDITEASPLPYQIFTTYHLLYIFISLLLSQDSTV